SHEIRDKEGLLRRDMGQLTYCDLTKRVKALAQQVSAVEKIRCVRGMDRVLADHEVPAVSMLPQFAGRELRPARVVWVVVTCVSMAVEAQRDRILDFIRSLLRLRDDVVHLDLDALITMANTAVPCCVH